MTILGFNKARYLIIHSYLCKNKCWMSVVHLSPYVTCCWKVMGDLILYQNCGMWKLCFLCVWKLLPYLDLDLSRFWFSQWLVWRFASCSVAWCSQLDYTVLSQMTVIFFMFHSCRFWSIEIISWLNSVFVLCKHVAKLYMDVDILYSKYNFKVVYLYNSFMRIMSYQYSFIVQKLFFFTSTTIPVHFRWDMSSFNNAPFSLFWLSILLLLCIHHPFSIMYVVIACSCLSYEL